MLRWNKRVSLELSDLTKASGINSPQRNMTVPLTELMECLTQLNKPPQLPDVDTQSLFRRLRGVVG